jgi:hypothetical protein
MGADLYSPCVVYGVEVEEEEELGDEILSEAEANQIECYYGGVYDRPEATTTKIYGVKIDLKDATTYLGNQDVDDWARKFNLGQPRVLLALKCSW